MWWGEAHCCTHARSLPAALHACLLLGCLTAPLYASAPACAERPASCQSLQVVKKVVKKKVVVVKPKAVRPAAATCPLCHMMRYRSCAGLTAWPICLLGWRCATQCRLSTRSRLSPDIRSAGLHLTRHCRLCPPKLPHPHRRFTRSRRPRCTTSRRRRHRCALPCRWPRRRRRPRRSPTRRISRRRRRWHS